MVLEWRSLCHLRGPRVQWGSLSLISSLSFAPSSPTCWETSWQEWASWATGPEISWFYRKGGTGMWVPHESLQPWSTTGNRSGSFPSHLLHLRLQVHLPNLSPADVSWWFCDGGAFRTDQHGGNHGAGGGFLVGTNTPCIHGMGIKRINSYKHLL